MRITNTNKNIFAIAVSIVLYATGIAAQAEESGFTVEDAIRKQVFQELKSNVESLYQNSRLSVPGIDTSVSSRLAQNNPGSGFALPLNIYRAPATKDKAAENIN